MATYLIGYDSSQEGAATNYKKQLSNGLSIFLKITADYKIISVAIFTSKELHKDVNADSIPPFKSTSFRLTALAKQNIMLYESIIASRFEKSFAAFVVSVRRESRIG